MVNKTYYDGEEAVWKMIDNKIISHLQNMVKIKSFVVLPHNFNWLFHGSWLIEFSIALALSTI